MQLPFVRAKTHLVAACRSDNKYRGYRLCETNLLGSLTDEGGSKRNDLPDSLDEKTSHYALQVSCLDR
jgi:hypothetical protein